MVDIRKRIRMKTYTLVPILLVIALTMNGCSRCITKSEKMVSGAEVVLREGDIVSATTDVGTIKVHAGPGYFRTYEWNGAKRSVELWPRNERWYGSLGLYYPGPGFHWEEHEGIARCCVEEGQQHVRDEDEFYQWLNKRKIAQKGHIDHYVYNSTGLVVGWSKFLPRKELNVEVWQVLVNGSKPANLKGANDKAVFLTSEKTTTSPKTKEPRDKAEKDE
jgi:hypothetical protein